MAKYKRVQTADSLEAIAAHIEEAAGWLKTVAAFMRAAKIDALEVGNDDQMRRAREYLDNYVGETRSALRKAKEDRGDFSGEQPPKRRA